MEFGQPAGLRPAARGSRAWRGNPWLLTRAPSVFRLDTGLLQSQPLTRGGPARRKEPPVIRWTAGTAAPAGRPTTSAYRMEGHLSSLVGAVASQRPFTGNGLDSLARGSHGRRGRAVPRWPGALCTASVQPLAHESMSVTLKEGTTKPWQGDEKAPCPEKRTVPLRNQGSFLSLLGGAYSGRDWTTISPPSAWQTSPPLGRSVVSNGQRDRGRRTRESWRPLSPGRPLFCFLRWFF